MVKIKQSGKASSIPLGLTYGVISALSVTILGAAITAKLLDNENIKHNQIGYAIMIFMIISVWIGSIVSIHKIKRQKVMVSLLTATIFYCVLLILNALLFGGDIYGAGETALLVLCGGMLPVLFKSKENKPHKIKKLKTYNR